MRRLKKTKWNGNKSFHGQRNSKLIPTKYLDIVKGVLFEENTLSISEERNKSKQNDIRITKSMRNELSNG